MSTLLAGLIGIPLGIISAVHQYKLIDNISSVFALIFLAMPGFWFALILIIQFSLKWRLLPASGWYGVKYMILPILANGTGLHCGHHAHDALEYARGHPAGLYPYRTGQGPPRKTRSS